MYVGDSYTSVVDRVHSNMTSNLSNGSERLPIYPITGTKDRTREMYAFHI